MALATLDGTGLARRCVDVGELDRDAATGADKSSCLAGGVTVVELDTSRGGTTVEFCEAGVVGEVAGVDFVPASPGKLIPNPFNAVPTSTIRIKTVQFMLT